MDFCNQILLVPLYTLEQRCSTFEKDSPHFSKIGEIVIITWKCDKMLKMLSSTSYTTKMGPYLHFCLSKEALKEQWPSGF